MINSRNIIRRTIFEEIVKYIMTNDVIVLHGARQVGKTFILYYLEKYLKQEKRSVYYLDLEDSRNRDILEAGVDEFIKHLAEQGFDPQKANDKIYVLVDEIQYLSNPSSFLKLIADHQRGIKLIVSGSSSFAIKSKFKDSLVGRTVNFEIYPLSFAEFLTFKNYSYNQATLKKDDLTLKKREELMALFKEYVLHGGYPKIVLENDLELKEKYLQQIIDTYIKKDIRDLARIKDVDKFNKLVEVLASQSGNLLDISELSNTCNLAKRTVENYLFILENTYLIKLVKPYHKNIRSELFKTPKVFFYDSGLMQMIWLKQLQRRIMGNVLETAVFGELVKRYGQGSVQYWRTTDKKEIDFILKLKNKIIPLEVKLNFGQFNKTSLEYFCDKYQIKDYLVIALEGEVVNKKFIYPWSLYFN